MTEPIRSDEATLQQSFKASVTADLNSSGTSATEATEVPDPVRAGPTPTVPGYRIGKKLGEGAYGEVWLAHEEGTCIEVAIKFFAHGTGLEWQLLQAEVKQLALLQADPGIVQLKDVELGTTPPYYVMAYAEQGCLAQRLARGPLPLDEALPIFRQVTATLAYVHAKGIRHCDLKPGNVLLDARRRALVADFGQAHLSNDASPALGTFFYMAPEQSNLDKQIPDTRWDVYGLGALLYAMLVGRPPRDTLEVRTELAQTRHLTNRLERYRALVAQSPAPTDHRRVAGMDRPLAELIDSCLAVDPEQRPHDAGAVLEALVRRERYRRNRPVRLFAFVAPLLLLAIMASVIFQIVAPLKEAVDEAQARMARQVHQRNEYLARILATDVREQLDKRIRLLEEIAQEVSLPAALQRKQTDQLDALLSKQEARWKRTGGSEGLNEDKSLFSHTWITDRDGEIHAIHPPAALPAKTNFAHRDWFHGQGGDLTPGAKTLPVAKTYLGPPYVSTVKGKPLKVAISTPIRNPQSQAVLGLVSGSIDLYTFHGWFKQLNLDQSFAVLLNQHGHYLFHPETEKIKPREGEPPARFPVGTEVFEEMVVGKRFGTTRAAFLDPINEKTYRASYAADPVLGWGVIFQEEEKPKTERLLEEMNRTLLTASLVALAIFAVVVPALWGWLRWMLRKQEA